MSILPRWMSDDDLDPVVEKRLEETGSEFDLQYWRDFIDGPEDAWLEQGQEFLSPLGITVTGCRDDENGDMLEWYVEALPGVD